MNKHLPSVAALLADDDCVLHRELGGLAVRRQTAVVRMLLDQLESLSLVGEPGSLRAQLVEELGRLGCMVLEAAASVSETTAPEPASGTRLA